MYSLNSKDEHDFELYRKRTRHVGPHLHSTLELVLVLDGTFELGIGRELYHMEPGDLGVIFPAQLHHYQDFNEKPGRVEYLICAPALSGPFLTVLQTMSPAVPVIPAAKVHPDILYALKTLTGRRTEQYDDLLHAAYLQIILSRALPVTGLKERMPESEDLTSRIINYIAAHYTEDITLESMAKDLFVNPYVISRSFSSAFQMNFNRYLNRTRLEYSRYLLEETDRSITEICLDSGFGSQRSFNRVFRQEYHMTPLEYRKFIRTPQAVGDTSPEAAG